MKHIKDLKVGDIVWTWDVQRHKPIPSTVLTIAVDVKIQDMEGRMGGACLAITDSIYPDDMIQPEIAQSADEVRELRMKDLLHEADCLRKAMLPDEDA